MFHKVEPGYCDGFRVDEDGNLWSSAADGVHCIAPSGDLLGKIKVPSLVSNLVFGGRNRAQLFICASHTLYAIYTNQRGAQRAVTVAQRIQTIGFTTADLAGTERFYGALGFEPLTSAPVSGAELAMLGLPGSRAERLTMRLGRQEVEFLSFAPPGRPYPANSTSTDLWFQHIAIAVSDMAEAHRRVLEAGAVAITQDGPQTLPANTGGVTAFKFRDPEGHPLELLFFPSGTGEKVWQERGALSPFLGIDHTAIAVSDPDRSRAFYATLGLRSRPGSENQGPGQERLDDVRGRRRRGRAPWLCRRCRPMSNSWATRSAPAARCPPERWPMTSGPRGSSRRQSWQSRPRSPPGCCRAARVRP